MELRDILVFLTTAGAAGVAYWLLNNVQSLAKLSPQYKRIASIVLSAGIAILAYLAQVAMLYAVAPVDTRAWIEALVTVGTSAFGLSQVVHGFTLSNTAKA